MCKSVFLKLSVFSIIVLSLWLFLGKLNDVSAADSVNVTLKINTWTITYATWSSLNLWSGSASYMTQTLSWSWTTDAFRVSDTRWTSTWNWSAQIGNATAWSFVISWDNFQIKDVWVAQPHFMQWDSSCWMATQLTTSYQYFTWWSAKNFLSKTNNSRICKYGVTPNIQVTIPANQPIWDYTATVTLSSNW